MKRVELGFVLLIVCSLVSASTTMRANAGDYLGEFCWNFTNTTTGASGVLSLGVEHIGDGHYLCSGKGTIKSPVSLIVPVFGNAEIVDGKIVITVTVPGRRNGNLGPEIIYITLNSNFNGTFESTGVYSDKIEVSEGTVAYTTCP